MTQAIARAHTFNAVIEHGGVPTTISVKIATHSHEKYASLRSYDVSLYIQPEGEPRQSLGWMYAYTLYKDIPDHDGQPAWHRELLRFSKKQKAPHRFHASDRVVIGETQRIFQLMFDQQGEVREDFEDYEHLLTGDNVTRIHYISHYVLNNQFTSKGLGPPTMMAYLEALRTLPSHDRFHGTVVLSPAAIVDSYEQIGKMKAATGKKHHNHGEVQQKLIRSYQKSGYELWYDPSQTGEEGDIAIMGRFLPPPTRLQPAAPVINRALLPHTARMDVQLSAISYAKDDIWEGEFGRRGSVYEETDDIHSGLRAMMDIDNPGPGPFSGQRNQPRRSDSIAEMADILVNAVDVVSSSDEDDAMSDDEPQLDRVALNQAMLDEATYLWGGCRWLVDYDIQLSWLTRATASNRKLIALLFPEYELPSVARRHSQVPVPFDPEQEYRVRRILQEDDRRYLIDWEDDEETGQSYPPSWEPKSNANTLAVDEWLNRQARRVAPRKR